MSSNLAGRTRHFGRFAELLQAPLCFGGAGMEYAHTHRLARIFACVSMHGLARGDASAERQGAKAEACRPLPAYGRYPACSMLSSVLASVSSSSPCTAMKIHFPSSTEEVAMVRMPLQWPERKQVPSASWL